MPSVETTLFSGDAFAWRGDASVASMASGMALFASSRVDDINPSVIGGIFALKRCVAEVHFPSKSYVSAAYEQA